MKKYTAESVTEGHPDKVCDIIADSVLDECLRFDMASRVACEVMATKGHILVAGEITSRYIPRVPEIVRDVLRRVGYPADRYTLEVLLHRQSTDISAGVTGPLEARTGQAEGMQLGAGDQGVMVGYACSETPEKMPLAVMLAHRITRRLADVRKTGETEGLLPDGKAQVTVEYGDGQPVRLDTVVLSAQHRDDVQPAEFEQALREKVLIPALRALPPMKIPVSLSTHPGVLCWAGRTRIRASRAENSWWTATGRLSRTAAERSAERTPPRWTAAGHIWRGTLQKTSWQRSLRKDARSRSPMPSARRSRSWWRWTPLVQARCAPMTVSRWRRGMCSV